MKYTIHSTPWLHAPGFVRWIEEALLPSNPDKARETYEALGLPSEVAENLAFAEVRAFEITFDEDKETATITLIDPPNPAGDITPRDLKVRDLVKSALPL